MTTATIQAPPVSDPIFEVSDVTLRFGGVVSLAEVTLQMARGEILAIIGPNGAGKTSLFNCLTGVYRPQEGRILFRASATGQPVSVVGRKTHTINHLGVARTFQNIRLFPALTALENVQIGVETRQRSGPISSMLGLPNSRRDQKQSVAKALDLLGFVGLQDHANNLASALPYGAQRRLEIARALGTSPAVLLLDEPAAGTNPSEKRELGELIRHINKAMAVSVLLIEHDMKLVMSVADRVMVLNFGRLIAAGTPHEIQRDPDVIAAYLGVAPGDDGAGPAGIEELP
jgi:branched-chain amino acid transport system ATP-binding protein